MSVILWRFCLKSHLLAVSFELFSSLVYCCLILSFFLSQWKNLEWEETGVWACRFIIDKKANILEHLFDSYDINSDEKIIIKEILPIAALPSYATTKAILPFPSIFIVYWLPLLLNFCLYFIYFRFRQEPFIGGIKITVRIKLIITKIWFFWTTKRAL